MRGKRKKMLTGLLRMLHPLPAEVSYTAAKRRNTRHFIFNEAGKRVLRPGASVQVMLAAMCDKRMLKLLKRDWNKGIIAI